MKIVFPQVSLESEQFRQETIVNYEGESVTLGEILQ